MKRNNLIVILISFLFVIACNDEFMERYPKDKLSDQGYWNSISDLEIYSNSLYSYLIRGHDLEFQMSPTVFGDQQSDNMAPLVYDIIAAGEHIVPPSSNQNEWNWEYVRKCNFFITRYNQTPVPQTQKDAIAGEVFLFRAWEYFNKVKKYGDVPWIGKDIGTNSEELYAPRTPRKVVMDSVLQDLNFAIAVLPAKENAKTDRINREIAIALKARICLHEGTFRKYHELGDHEKFLREAANAAQTLINEQKYQLFSTGNPAEDYRNCFNDYDLTGNPEMILFKKYDYSLITTAIIWALDENEQKTGVTKSLVDSYLCSDGLPISQSTVFLGHDSIKGELQNRDPRLLQTVCYPGTEMQKETGKPAIPGANLGVGTNPTGYRLLKYWKDDPEEVRRNAMGSLDCPVIRFAEILLIYAEAKAELGESTQAVIDQTINLLRERVGMPDMVIANLEKDENSDFPDLDVLIDEIRRERRVELACEGFRYDDLIRWKAGKLLENKVLGMKFKPKDYPEVNVGQDIFLDENGFIDVYKRALPNGRTFTEPKHYYFPIPTNELVINKNLIQNPSW